MKWLCLFVLLLAGCTSWKEKRRQELYEMFSPEHADEMSEHVVEMRKEMHGK